MKELDDIVSDVFEKTGISVKYYTKSDAFGSTYSGSRPEPDFNDVYSDEAKKLTFFRFIFKGVKCTGVISGAGKTERNYAIMLSGLINAPHKTSPPVNKNDVLKNIVTGEAEDEDIAKFISLNSIPEAACYVMLFYADGGMGGTERLISHAGTNKSDFVVHIDENSCALVKFCIDDSDYHSAADYAGIISQSIYEELMIKVSIGIGNAVKNFSEVSASFFQARTALRLSRYFAFNGTVHTYNEYMLLKMLEDIPFERRKEYLSPFMSEEVKALLSDREIEATAEGFFESNLNLSEASRKLYIHRNTITYRLDKIERVTGLDIRKFSDAVSFRVLTFLFKSLD